MRAQRFIKTVPEDGLLHLNIGRAFGTKVEVIVLCSEEDAPSVTEQQPAIPRENIAFADGFLGNPAEDVWDEL